MHNEKFFKPGTSNFLTQDEESSGVIDASEIIEDGWFLADVQARQNIAATDPELVERGQLFALDIDPSLEASVDHDGDEND
jgi:hypothetical protein